MVDCVQLLVESVLVGAGVQRQILERDGEVGSVDGGVHGQGAGGGACDAELKLVPAVEVQRADVEALFVEVEVVKAVATGNARAVVEVDEAPVAQLWIAEETEIDVGLDPPDGLGRDVGVEGDAPNRPGGLDESEDGGIETGLSVLQVMACQQWRTSEMVVKGNLLAWYQEQWPSLSGRC